MVSRRNPKGFHGFSGGPALFILVASILTFPVSSMAGICGDINGDQIINMNDITFIISYLYKNGACPENLAMCDVNQSQSINILDPIFLLSFLNKEGPSPTYTSSGPGGSVISDSGCKSYYKAAEATATEDSCSGNMSTVIRSKSDTKMAVSTAAPSRMLHFTSPVTP